VIVERVVVRGVDRAALRALCARTGWLVESPDCLRAGFGHAVAVETLAGGLASGEVPTVLGAIEVSSGPAPSAIGPVAFATVPFERSGQVSLWVPEHQFACDRDGVTWVLSARPDEALAAVAAESLDDVHAAYHVKVDEYSPSPDGYARAVASAVELMRHSEIQKVVLARRVLGQAGSAIDAAAVLQRLHEREPACTLICAPDRGGRFIGASPELVVSCEDGAVSAHPLAGTIAVPREDDGPEYAAWLLGSSKNLFEHRVVVDDLVERLSTRCDDVRADARPSVVALRSVAHLGTWIHGKVRPSEGVTAFELLSLVHPTAAVGGIPQERALEVIHELEPTERGLYAGAVGWIDRDGSGQWWLAIRGLSINGARFDAWAGAGIVADSDPVAEREETGDKLTSILGGFGTC
jgi:isochorismate synthase